MKHLNQLHVRMRRILDYWFRDPAIYEFYIQQQFAHQQKRYL